MKKTMIMMACMAFMQALIGQTHWTPVSGIQNNMTVSAVLYVNGEEQHADYVEIGAFCGEDCRAAALPYEVEGEQVYFLTIRGNAGDAITFRLYDHQMQAELDYVCEQAYTFVVDDILGDWPDWYPIRFSAPISTTEQTVQLALGWNWFSSYIDPGDPIVLLDMLKEALGDNAIEIQSYDDNTECMDGEWFGGLDDIGIDNAQTYMILAANDCTIELEGPATDPANYPITLHRGWNWIGFPCAQEVSVADAFAGFEPEEGDVLQSYDNMTEFDGEDWWGELETLVPGQGLMYYSMSDELKELVFQTGTEK